MEQRRLKFEALEVEVPFDLNTEAGFHKYIQDIISMITSIFKSKGTFSSQVHLIPPETPLLSLFTGTNLDEIEWMMTIRDLCHRHQARGVVEAHLSEVPPEPTKLFADTLLKESAQFILVSAEHCEFPRETWICPIMDGALTEFLEVKVDDLGNLMIGVEMKNPNMN